MNPWSEVSTPHKPISNTMKGLWFGLAFFLCLGQFILPASWAASSVKLRVMAANPSANKTQYVPIKIYLPQEATPKDILDKGDLELNYDSEKSLYFVFKERVPLAPNQVRIFEVELDDIWFISKDKIEGDRNRTKGILERLEDTQYMKQAQFVADTIYSRLDQVAASQADESVSKELHIGLYRSNSKVMEQIEADIARLEKLLVAVGAAPAPEILAESKLNLKTPSRATTWFIIFAILIFIGLLGAVFFFTWQAQVRMASGLASKIEHDVFPEFTASSHKNLKSTPSDESGPSTP